ncbi:hypothetical protein CPC08DRAFT_713717 [Agrocybe pediades]|nr:hypothetical protein CPC08DRAFT_713717 [Agrocybe pediades]
MELAGPSAHPCRPSPLFPPPRTHTLMNATSTFNDDPRNTIRLHSSSKIIPIERAFEGDGEEYYPSDTYALALEADRNEASAWV